MNDLLYNIVLYVIGGALMTVVVGAILVYVGAFLTLIALAIYAPFEWVGKKLISALKHSTL